MQVVVNGSPREVSPGCTVAALLAELRVEPRHVAVEINLELLPRAQHSRYALVEGDRLEVVTLVGGG
jgi:sulfur carrier protein